MRTLFKNLMMVMSVAATVFAVESAEAQRGKGARGSGGWGADAPFSRLYDEGTVQTLRGEVVRVETAVPQRGMGPGVHLVLKTENETVPVHLGPAWFLENQDVALKAGDRVQVVGSRVTLEGKPALIAARVTRGEDVLLLRDEKGFPAWSGWRRSGMGPTR